MVRVVMGHNEAHVEEGRDVVVQILLQKVFDHQWRGLNLGNGVCAHASTC